MHGHHKHHRTVCVRKAARDLRSRTVNQSRTDEGAAGTERGKNRSGSDGGGGGSEAGSAAEGTEVIFPKQPTRRKRSRRRRWWKQEADGGNKRQEEEATVEKGRGQPGWVELAGEDRQ